MRLRGYQQKAVGEIDDAWCDGARVVGLRMPTGSGKTPTLSAIVRDESGPCVVSAHRSELVGQLSMAMAANEVRHRIISKNQPLINGIIREQIKRFGRHYYDHNARCSVASTQTLIRVNDPSWYDAQKLWVNDEGHHTLADNIWGRSVRPMRNARGLLVTATPIRPDGKGIGSMSAGLADVLILGPSERELFDMGYLCPYRVFVAESHINVANVPTSASGDYSPDPLRKAVHADKQLVGNIVKEYLRRAPGKLGLTFCVDVEAAEETAREYNAAGIPAAVITGDTDTLVRVRTMADFRARRLLQIVSVDILGEGVDIPGVEVVSMARPTKSYVVYSQQLGRLLRLLLPDHLQAVWEDLTPEQRRYEIARSDKPVGILIDHAGNFLQPGFGHVWTERDWMAGLMGRKRTSYDTAIPADEALRLCLNPCDPKTGLPCGQPYLRILPACPFCGHEPVPVERGGPEHVDGDMTEISGEWIQDRLREIAQIDGHNVLYPRGAPPAVIRQQHIDRQRQQDALRGAMQWWGAYYKQIGDTDRMMQRRFYLKFGVDVMSAQTLGRKDAADLYAAVVADQPWIEAKLYGNT